MAWPCVYSSVYVQLELNVHLNPILAWLRQDQMVIRPLLLKILALTLMMKRY